MVKVRTYGMRSDLMHYYIESYVSEDKDLTGNHPVDRQPVEFNKLRDCNILACFMCMFFCPHEMRQIKRVNKFMMFRFVYTFLNLNLSLEFLNFPI